MIACVRVRLRRAPPIFQFAAIALAVEMLLEAVDLHAATLAGADRASPVSSVGIVLALEPGRSSQVPRAALLAKRLVAGGVEAGKESRPLRRVLAKVAVLVLRRARINVFFSIAAALSDRAQRRLRTAS